MTRAEAAAELRRQREPLANLLGHFPTDRLDLLMVISILGFPIADLMRDDDEMERLTLRATGLFQEKPKSVLTQLSPAALASQVVRSADAREAAVKAGHELREGGR